MEAIKIRREPACMEHAFKREKSERMRSHRTIESRRHFLRHSRPAGCYSTTTATPFPMTISQPWLHNLHATPYTNLDAPFDTSRSRASTEGNSSTSDLIKGFRERIFTHVLKIYNRLADSLVLME